MRLNRDGDYVYSIPRIRMSSDGVYLDSFDVFLIFHLLADLQFPIRFLDRFVVFCSTYAIHISAEPMLRK